MSLFYCERLAFRHRSTTPQPSSLAEQLSHSIDRFLMPMFLKTYSASGLIAAALSGTILGATALPVLAQDVVATPVADARTMAIVAAAEAFLATLSDEQRASALFDWTDQAQRVNWSNFPLGGPGADRKGVRWGDMTDAQRDALTALLGEVLSRDGLRMVEEQVAADDIVAAQDAAGDAGPPVGASDEAQAADAASADEGPEGGDQGGPPPGGRPPVSFGSAYYFVSFVGAPSTSSPWMLQFGGHHLAINATVVGPDVTLSPSLTGGQPLKFTLAGRPVYIVVEEAVQAAALLGALSEEQRGTAIVSDQLSDLVLGPGHDGEVLQPEGLSGSQMTETQKAQFLELIEARLGILNDDDLSVIMAPAEANLDQTTFGWWGPTEPLGAAYVRVTGPTVILEFSPQVNDGDPTDHAHNMYRDPTNEYGAAWTAP